MKVLNHSNNSYDKYQKLYDFNILAFQYFSVYIFPSTVSTVSQQRQKYLDVFAFAEHGVFVFWFFGLTGVPPESYVASSVNTMNVVSFSAHLLYVYP